MQQSTYKINAVNESLKIKEISVIRNWNKIFFLSDNFLDFLN